MKVRVYLTVMISGLKCAGGSEMDTQKEMLSFDGCFPALPRPGDFMELQDGVVAGSPIVEQVNWFPDPDKQGVFFPVVYLEEDDYFNKNYDFSPTATLAEKILVLKQLVAEAGLYHCNA